MVRYPLYIVVIHVSRPISIDVGALGRISFNEGYYVYVGSGGRAPYSRIRRHFDRIKKPRWHIDYLTQYYPACDAYIIWRPGTGEYGLARFLENRYRFVRGFGSSDSPSKSHLFYIGGEGELCRLVKILKSELGAEHISID